MDKAQGGVGAFHFKLICLERASFLQIDSGNLCFQIVKTKEKKKS